MLVKLLKKVYFYRIAVFGSLVLSHKIVTSVTKVLA